MGVFMKIITGSITVADCVKYYREEGFTFNCRDGKVKGYDVEGRVTKVVSA